MTCQQQQLHMAASELAHAHALFSPCLLTHLLLAGQQQLQLAELAHARALCPPCLLTCLQEPGSGRPPTKSAHDHGWVGTQQQNPQLELKESQLSSAYGDDRDLSCQG